MCNGDEGEEDENLGEVSPKNKMVNDFGDWSLETKQFRLVVNVR